MRDFILGKMRVYVNGCTEYEVNVYFRARDRVDPDSGFEIRRLNGEKSRGRKASQQRFPELRDRHRSLRLGRQTWKCLTRK